MTRTHVDEGTPHARPGPIDFMRRLREIDMFFQKRGKVHQTMRRVARSLEEAGIPYALMGAMAVNAHGAERTTKDVDILLNTHGLERFRNELAADAFEQVPGRPRRFVDLKNGVTLDILVTGLYPGRGGPGPFAFPDPAEASQKIGKIRVVTLPHLVQLKLAARRYYDFGDVVFLIRVHDLDESFAEQLHPSVRRDYIECLEEKRREDEYEARA
jgi:hypothetical protein